MFETAETNRFSSFETAVFLGRFAVVVFRRFVRVGKTLRLSNGTPWERQLWILLRGGGRKWISSPQPTGVMKGKPPTGEEEVFPP